MQHSSFTEYSQQNVGAVENPAAGLTLPMHALSEELSTHSLQHICQYTLLPITLELAMWQILYCLDGRETLLLEFAVHNVKRLVIQPLPVTLITA